MYQLKGTTDTWSNIDESQKSILSERIRHKRIQHDSVSKKYQNRENEFMVREIRWIVVFRGWGLTGQENFLGW